MLERDWLFAGRVGQVLSCLPWVLLLLEGSELMAQSPAPLEIKVVNRLGGHPVVYAVAVLRDTARRSALIFGETDEAGLVSLELPAATIEGLMHLEVNALGYLPYRTDLTREAVLKGVTVELTYADNQLQEIVVRDSFPAITYRPDTVTYNAAAFATGDERKLKDLLEKMPGLAVDDKMNVTYQGEPVSVLLVENKPFFGGGSELALRGIPADAVGRIQILEDYKPLGFSTDAYGRKQIALNVLIKEDKKNIYFGEVEALAGAPRNYFGRADLFRFSKKSNLYTTLGGNNVNEELLSLPSLIRVLNGGALNFSLANMDQTINASQILRPTFPPSLINQQLGALGGNFELTPRSLLNVFVLLPRTDAAQTKITRTDLQTLAGDTLRELLREDGNFTQRTAVVQLDLKTILPKKQFILASVQLNRNGSNLLDTERYQSSLAAILTNENTTANSHRTKGEVQFGAQPKERHKFLGRSWVVLANNTDSLRLRSDLPLLIDLGGANSTLNEFLQRQKDRELQAGLEVQYTHPVAKYFSLAHEGSFMYNYWRQSISASAEEIGGAASLRHGSLLGGTQLNFRKKSLTSSLGFKFQRITWQLPGQTQNRENYLLPDFYFDARLGSASHFTLTAREQVAFPEAASFYPGRFVTGPNVSQQGNPLLIPTPNRSAEATYRVNYPIKHLGFRLRASLSESKGPQVVSAFTLRNASRLYQPVVIDENSLNWKISAEGTYNSSWGTLELNLSAGRDQNFVVNDGGTLLTNDVNQEIFLSWAKKVSEVVRITMENTAIRSVFTSTQRFSVYSNQSQAEVDFHWGPLQFTAVVQADYTAFSDAKNIRSTARIDLLYAFPNHPWALRLMAATPLGPAQLFSFDQSDLIFQETIEFLLPTYLTVGATYQF